MLFASPFLRKTKTKTKTRAKLQEQKQPQTQPQPQPQTQTGISDRQQRRLDERAKRRAIAQQSVWKRMDDSLATLMDE
ncbi:hypothetical protein TWF730_010229 [Orbilia blumenaviensis]|uniref:Uncharacterized protein n=1 Tax=Orbilia blumenaviensis TaxID=1796055 RepID=A0AAV9UN33_9PEZI